MVKMNKVINLSEKDVLKLKLNISGENNIIFWVMTSRAAIKRLKASHDNEKQVRLPF